MQNFYRPLTLITKAVKFNVNVNKITQILGAVPIWGLEELGLKQVKLSF